VANERLGLDGGTAWTAAFSATWEGPASLPTLAFGNYLELDADGEWTGACPPNVLYRPAASGTTYAPPIALDPSWCTLSLLFSDWDRSGRRDLRVSNDRHYYPESSDGEEQLWRITPGGEPSLYAAADGWKTVRVWGMGIASQDLDGDGYPEVYLTSQGDNKLERLAEGPDRPDYRDIAVARDAAAGRPATGGDPLPSTGWHAEFDDVNNDGFMDLFVAKGNVEAMPDYASKDPSNLLIGRADGTFVESAEAAGVLSYARGRGAALVDLNLDGLLDLVEVNRRENVKVWRNVGAGTAEAPAPVGHWLAIQPDDPERYNHDAIGAWVAIRVGDRVLEREVTVGGGHAGGQRGPTHVGLGAAERAEVRVTWPDGTVGPWVPVMADRYVTIDRGGLVALPWPPTRP
jgi:enediyne biosynthesis protein E4